MGETTGKIVNFNGESFTVEWSRFGKFTKIDMNQFYNMMDDGTVITAFQTYLQKLENYNEKYALFRQLLDQGFEWALVKESIEKGDSSIQRLVAQSYQNRYKETQDQTLINTLRDLSDNDHKGNILQHNWDSIIDTPIKNELIQQFLLSNPDFLVTCFKEKLQHLYKGKKKEILISIIKLLPKEIQEDILKSFQRSNEDIQNDIKNIPYTPENLAFMENQVEELRKERDAEIQKTEEWTKEYYRERISPIKDIIKNVQENSDLRAKEREINGEKYKLSKDDIQSCYIYPKSQGNEELKEQHWLTTNELTTTYILTPCNKKDNQEVKRTFVENNGEVYEIIEKIESPHPNYKTLHCTSLRNSQWEKCALLEKRFIFKEPEGNDFQVIYDGNWLSGSKYTCIIGNQSFSITYTGR